MDEVDGETDIGEVEFLETILKYCCHFDGGEIFARSSTKIDDFYCGVSREDFSFVEMTN